MWDWVIFILVILIVLVVFVLLWRKRKTKNAELTRDTLLGQSNPDPEASFWNIWSWFRD